MSINFQYINNIISGGVKANDLLEKKIRENELDFQALENEESNPNYLEEINSKNYISKRRKKEFLNPIDVSEEEENNNINNHQITLPSTKMKLNKNDFSFSSNKTSAIETNMSNNSDTINKNIYLNASNSTHNLLVITKENNAYYLPNIKKNNIHRKISIFNLENADTMAYNNNKDKYYQYISFLSNQNKRNKSAEKRTNKKYRNNPINKTVNDDKFASTYKRFIEKDKEIKEKVSMMKKLKEEQETIKYPHKPLIDKNSRKITSRKNEDFFSRQKRLMEKKEKKNAVIKSRVKTKENEQIKTNKKIKNKKDRKRTVEETIHKLYDWDTKRKEKLNKIRKSKERKELNDNIHSKSNKKVKLNLSNVVNRLYKADIEKRRVKTAILSNLLTPTFQPLITRNNSPKSNRSNYNKNNSLTKKKLNNSSYENTIISKKSDLNYDDSEIISVHRKNSRFSDMIRNYLLSKIKRRPKKGKIVKFEVEDEIREKKHKVSLHGKNRNRKSSNDNTHISYNRRTIKKIIFQ